MKPIITTLSYTYKKEDSDVWVLNHDDIPVDKSKVKDQQIVHLSPGSVGGNHKHPRTEWFVAIGQLMLYWLDDEGNTQSEHMNPNDQILLIEIPPQLPHSVKNISTSSNGVLFEFADGKMRDVIDVDIIEEL